ncbi:MAG: Asp23/Gls24 family envelope stress response protein [Candidatus Omnitrophota bacterium]|jgi:uncharacterized alkaline shock family protein YloU
MPHKDESVTDLGAIKIHKNAIASIAAIAAIEIEGVKRVGGNLQSGLFSIVGKKSYSAIRVEINKSGEAAIEIPLIIKYGYNIPEIANKVQENVRQSVEKMTSLSVRDINIKVKAIEKE